MSLLIDVTGIAYQWSKESLFPQLKEHCKQMIVFPWNTQIYNTMLQHSILFTLKWKNNSVLVLHKWIICVHQHHIGCIALLLFTNFQKNCCFDFWLVILSDYWLGVSPSAFSFLMMFMQFWCILQVIKRFRICLSILQIIWTKEGGYWFAGGDSNFCKLRILSPFLFIYQRSIFG